jgi:APA family basic amino acid/polyamine antiporter
MTELQRTISRNDVALLVVGSVIGSGIFLVPGGVLTQSGGSVGLAMLAWLFGGVLSLLGALTYGELGAMQPQAGGLYLYIRDAFGPLLAFLYGWVIFFCICAGTVATLAVASSTYLQAFIPMGETGRKITSVIIVALIALLNIRGTKISVRALNVAPPSRWARSRSSSSPCPSSAPAGSRSVPSGRPRSTRRSFPASAWR